jgi:RNA polymerase sigma-70 factor (ECF subfamily)
MSLPDPFPGNSISGETSDHSLLRRVKNGNERAATELYLRYAARLNALAKAKSSPELAKRVEAEEIVQSVFGSFFRGAQKGYYDVPVGEELWKLFLVIGLNKIRAKGSYHLADKRDSRRTQDAETLSQQEEEQAEDSQVALKVLELTINESLQAFPPHYREILELRVEGFEITEIATKTQRSKRTVERILQEIREHLAQILNQP